MPKTIKPKSIARKSRKSIDAGKNTSGTGRKRSTGKTAKASGAIADSIHSLVLQPKPASIINSARCRPYYDEDDYQQMYRDLREITIGALKSLGEKTTYDPLALGFDIGISISSMLNLFSKSVLPKGYDFNIEREHNGSDYYIVVYKACDFNGYWHEFEMFPIISYLKKKNLKLHNFFIRFMANFSDSTGVLTWYNGGLGYVDDDYMMERIENEEFDSEEEEYESKAQVLQEIHSYKSGEVNNYERRMRAARCLPITNLRKDLLQFSKRNILVKWMHEALEVMEEPYNAERFCYWEEQERSEGLSFDQQLAIVWSSDDWMTKEQGQYLDSEANGCGVMDPIYHVRLTKEAMAINGYNFKKAEGWPTRMSKLYHQFNEVIKQYER